MKLIIHYISIVAISATTLFSGSSLFAEQQEANLQLISSGEWNTYKLERTIGPCEIAFPETPSADNEFYGVTSYTATDKEGMTFKFSVLDYTDQFSASGWALSCIETADKYNCINLNGLFPRKFNSNHATTNSIDPETGTLTTYAFVRGYSCFYMLQISVTNPIYQNLNTNFEADSMIMDQLNYDMKKTDTFINSLDPQKVLSYNEDGFVGDITESNFESSWFIKDGNYETQMLSYQRTGDDASQALFDSSWSIGEDGLILNFKLQEGLRFESHLKNFYLQDGAGIGFSVTVCDGYEFLAKDGVKLVNMTIYARVINLFDDPDHVKYEITCESNYSGTTANEIHVDLTRTTNFRGSLDAQMVSPDQQLNLIIPSENGDEAIIPFSYFNHEKNFYIDF